MTPLETEKERLRHSVGRNDFAAAEAAGHRYAWLLELGLQHLPPAERATQLARARELFEWARRNLLAARTRLDGDLRRLQPAVRYGSAAVAIPTWKLEG